MNIAQLEDTIRTMRRLHTAAGGIEDTPEIEALVARLNAECTCQLNDIPWHDNPTCPHYDPAPSFMAELVKTKAELAYVRLQRDALLEMTWLDLPSEPTESIAKWRMEFEKGWERKEIA